MRDSVIDLTLPGAVAARGTCHCSPCCLSVAPGTSFSLYLQAHVVAISGESARVRDGLEVNVAGSRQG